MEPLGDLGSSEGGDDIGGRGIGVCETSVLEVRCIGGEDIDGEDHTRESDCCEYLPSAPALVTDI